MNDGRLLFAADDQKYFKRSGLPICGRFFNLCSGTMSNIAKARVCKHLMQCHPVKPKVKHPFIIAVKLSAIRLQICNSQPTGWK